MIVNMPPQQRRPSSGARPASAQRSLYIPLSEMPKDIKERMRPLSARVDGEGVPRVAPAKIRPKTARPRMTGEESTGTRIGNFGDMFNIDLSSVIEREEYRGGGTVYNANSPRCARSAPKERTARGDALTTSVMRDKDGISLPPAAANKHLNIMNVAQRSLATAHAALKNHYVETPVQHSDNVPESTRHTRQSISTEDSEETTSQVTRTLNKIEDQMDIVESRLKSQAMIPITQQRPSKSPRSCNRAAMPRIRSVLAAEIAEAQEIMRDTSRNSNTGGEKTESQASSSRSLSPAPRSSKRKGPMTPRLLQRPLATDFDEDVVLRHGGESASRGACEDVPTTAWHGVARKGAKFKDKKGVGSKVINVLEDSAEIRRDALKRSVAAIESLSLALHSEQEEKKVLLRVLQACETTEVAAKRTEDAPAQVSLHADTIQGSSHLAQASFIAQMLPGVDPKVVERMPSSALRAMEGALALKLAHAQGVAKNLLLEEVALRGDDWKGPLNHLQGEQIVVKMREELEMLREENSRLRVNLMEATKELQGRGNGRSKMSDGSALIISFLQKDVAAAKARILLLQSEAASACAQARTSAEKAEEEKEALRKEIVSLHVRLEAFRAEVYVRESSRSDALTTQHTHTNASLADDLVDSRVNQIISDDIRGVRAAASVHNASLVKQGREGGERMGVEHVVSAAGNVLGGVLEEFNTQLARNYGQVREALQKAAEQENSIGDSVLRHVKHLGALIASFDAQLTYLQTPEGALSLLARGEHHRKYSRYGNDQDDRDRRIGALVAELDQLCVHREMDRRKLELQVQAKASTDSKTEREEGGGASRLSIATECFSTDGDDDDNQGVAYNELAGIGGGRGLEDEEVEDDSILLHEGVQDSSFTGRRYGRGGGLELEAWRETGRIEAQSIIESANIEAQCIIEARVTPREMQGGASQKAQTKESETPQPKTLPETTAEPTAPNNLHKVEEGGEAKLTLTFDANGRGLESGTFLHTPRSQTDTPPRSSALAEHARSLRVGAIHATQSFRTLQEHHEEARDSNTCARGILEGDTDGLGERGRSMASEEVRRNAESVGVELVQSVTQRVNFQPSGLTGERGDAREGGGKGRSGGAGGGGGGTRLARQRTIPDLMEAEFTDQEGEGEDEDEYEDEMTCSTTKEQGEDTNDSGSLDKRLTQLLCALENRCENLKSALKDV